MDSKDYKWMKRNCTLKVSFETEGDNPAVFEVRRKSHIKTLEKILNKDGYNIAQSSLPSNSSLPIMTTENFLMLQNKMNTDDFQFDFETGEFKIEPTEDEKNKELFEKISPKMLAKFSNEKKLDILYAIVPDNLYTPDEMKQFQDYLCGHSDKLTACLFSLKTPSNFWVDEEKKIDSFTNRLLTIPNFKESIEKWSEISLDSKKDILTQAKNVFCHTYGIENEVKISYFTKDEYLKERKEKGLDFDKSPVPAAEKRKDGIYINTEHLQKIDGINSLGLVFHEITHIAQETLDYSKYPDVEQIFDGRFDKLGLGGKDVSLLIPKEVHAYNMEGKFMSSLVEKANIRPSERTFSQYSDLIDRAVVAKHYQSSSKS